MTERTIEYIPKQTERDMDTIYKVKIKVTWPQEESFKYSELDISILDIKVFKAIKVGE